MLVLSATLGAAGQLLFRVGARDKTTALALFNLEIAAGLALYAIGTATWIFVLSREKLVDVYVFTALTFVLVYIGAVALLGEQIKVSSVVGIGLVLAGLFMVARANA